MKITIQFNLKVLFVVFSLGLFMGNHLFSQTKRYTYPDGHFSVEFPGEPAETIDGSFKKMTSVKGTMAYQVVYLPEDYDIAASSEDMFKQSFAMYGPIEGEVEKLVGENGLIGRKASVKNGASIYNVVVWQSATRNWTLCVGKRVGKVSKEDQDAFFSSFKMSTGSGQSVATTRTSNTNTSANSGSFDSYEYLKSKNFPLIANQDQIDDWTYPSIKNLIDHTQLDYLDIQNKINQYGEGAFQTSNAGKKALTFMRSDLPTLYPIIPQIVDKYLKIYDDKQAAEKAGDNFAKGMVDGVPQLKFLKVVENFAFVFSSLSGDARIKESLDKVSKKYDQAVNEVDFINSSVHKNRLDELIIYKGSPKIGEENKSNIHEVIGWNKGQTLFAYWPKNLKSSKNDIKFKFRTKGGYYFYQALYFDPEVRKTTFEKLGHVRFDFFPTPENLNYQTLYEFDAHINFLSYFMDLPNGINEIEFRIEAGNYEMEKVLFVEMSDDSRSELKKLKERLIEAKIAHTLLPICEDGSGIISNKDFFTSNGFGTLVKYVQTDPVEEMKDGEWPYPVIGHASGGWAILKQSDGTYEVVRIGVSKKKGAQNWIASVSPLPSKYDMTGNKTYNSAIGNHGYKMLSENLSKCSFWECE